MDLPVLSKEFLPERQYYVEEIADGIEFDSDIIMFVIVDGHTKEIVYSFPIDYGVQVIDIREVMNICSLLNKMNEKEEFMYLWNIQEYLEYPTINFTT